MPTEPLQPPFYSPRPVKIGRPYSSQLDEIRENSETTEILARAAGIDQAPANLKESALQAWELGDFGFHNRFRTIYDDLTGSFLIQRNTGTASAPTWSTSFEITSSGTVTAVNADHGDLTGLTDDDHTQYILADGTRAFGGVLTGNLHVDQIVTAEAFYTPDGGEVGGGGVSDHGALTGLADDDHTQYILADGTRAFSGNVDFGGFNLTGIGLITGDNHVEGSLTAEAFYTPDGGEVTGGGVTDHGALTGLADDDHTQYILADGTRAFSGFLTGNLHVDQAVTAEAFYTQSSGEIVPNSDKVLMLTLTSDQTLSTSAVESIGESSSWTTNKNTLGATVAADGEITLPTLAASGGINHIECWGQITFAGNATGQREVRFETITGTEIFGPDNNTPRPFTRVTSPSGATSDLIQCFSGIVPIAGGEEIAMRGFQNSGGNLAASGAAGNTWLTIRGIRLT